MTRVPNIETNGEVIVEIYDDYTSGFYNAEEVLNHLRSLSVASLEADDANNLWQQIDSFLA